MKRSDEAVNSAGDANAAADAALAARLRIGLARLSRLSRSAQHAADLTPSQLSVLAAVESSPNVRLVDLASGQGFTAPSATRVVQALVERGLVERHIDPLDKRACLVGLTNHGHEILANIRSQTTDFFTARIGELGRADKTKLHLAIAALERLAGIEK